MPNLKSFRTSQLQDTVVLWRIISMVAMEAATPKDLRTNFITLIKTPENKFNKVIKDQIYKNIYN